MKITDLSVTIGLGGLPVGGVAVVEGCAHYVTRAEFEKVLADAARVASEGAIAGILRMRDRGDPRWR